MRPLRKAGRITESVLASRSPPDVVVEAVGHGSLYAVRPVPEQPDENEVLLEAGWLKEGVSLEMENYAAVTYSYNGITMPVRLRDPFTAGAWRVHVIILPHVRGKVSISVKGPRNTATTYCAITRKGGERLTKVGSGQALCVANV